MLETLFSKKLKVKEKEEILEQKYGMRMTEEVRRGAEHMCNYSDWVEERAREEGLAKGHAEGENKLGRLVAALMKDDLKDIVELVATDEKVREEYYKKYGIE